MGALENIVIISKSDKEHQNISKHAFSVILW